MNFIHGCVWNALRSCEIHGPSQEKQLGGLYYWPGFRSNSNLPIVRLIESLWNVKTTVRI